MKSWIVWAAALMVALSAGLRAAAEDKPAPLTPEEKAAAAAAEKEEKKRRDEAVKKCLDDFAQQWKEASKVAPDSQINARANALQILGTCEVKDVKLVGKLNAFLMSDPSDKDGLMASTAADALASFRGVKQAVQALMGAAAAHKKNPRVLERIMAALGELKDEAAAPFLLDNLKSRDGRVAAAAARALGTLGSPQAVEPMIKLFEGLERDNKMMSETSVPGQGNQAGDEAKKEMRERYSVLSPAIKDALKQITGENIGFLEDWQDWWKKSGPAFVAKKRKGEGDKK